MESDPCHEQVGENEATPLHRRYRVHVHSRRKRLADVDGLSIKAVLDGLVRAGVLPDDSAKFIKEISFTQEKAKQEEATIIDIYWED
jgi:Holliday junction resolvase RusA-like endonuclease